MRIANDANASDIQRPRFDRQSFIGLVGDCPTDRYFPPDFQSDVTRTQYRRANASKQRGVAAGCRNGALINDAFEHCGGERSKVCSSTIILLNSLPRMS